MEDSFDNGELIVTTLAGLEEVCAKELESLGAENIEVLHRAVKFKGDKHLMYSVNYMCRTALRVLKPLYFFRCNDIDQYYRKLINFSWEKVFDVSDTFAIDVVGKHPSFTNTMFAAQKCKDAIADRFRKLYGRRPSVNIEFPDVRINIFLQQGQISVLLDSSGEPLFKRGWRRASVPAPINEVLAAGLILLSGWDKKKAFYDPFCGSGTIPVEAAMIATSTPAGFFRRKFGFMTWQDYDERLFKTVKEKFDQQVKKMECTITSSDISGRSVEIARRNIRSAGFEENIHVKISSFENLLFKEGTGVIIANPPYGERLKSEDIVDMYKRIGDKLKHNCRGYDAWVIGSDINAIKFIGLHPSKKIKVYNGPLECRFLHFNIY